MGGKVPEPAEMTVTVTVVQAGKPDIQLLCPGKRESLQKTQILLTMTLLTCMIGYISTSWVKSLPLLGLYSRTGGTNLRQLLVGNGINVYRSLTKWTNCNGKQRCGTCIVDVSTFQFILRENFSLILLPPFTPFHFFCFCLYLFDFLLSLHPPTFHPITFLPQIM